MIWLYLVIACLLLAAIIQTVRIRRRDKTIAKLIDDRDGYKRAYDLQQNNEARLVEQLGRLRSIVIKVAQPELNIYPCDRDGQAMGYMTVGFRREARRILGIPSVELDRCQKDCNNIRACPFRKEKAKPKADVVDLEIARLEGKPGGNRDN